MQVPARDTRPRRVARGLDLALRLFRSRVIQSVSLKSRMCGPQVRFRGSRGGQLPPATRPSLRRGRKVGDPATRRESCGQGRRSKRHDTELVEVAGRLRGVSRAARQRREVTSRSHGIDKDRLLLVILSSGVQEGQPFFISWPERRPDPGPCRHSGLIGPRHPGGGSVAEFVGIIRRSALRRY